MVYAVAYCREDFKETLAEQGFDDSKVLSHVVRSNLLQRMCEEESAANIGWGVHSLSAQDISSGMLRPKGSVYNLNSQAHDTTIALIRQVLEKGVTLSHVYVDTVGPPASYQAKLSRTFPGIAFTVAKKADSIYPIVSAASICAKVTRDAVLSLHDESDGLWGSGYPSDGKTSTWLRNTLHPLFGFSGHIRFSWQTITELINKQKGAIVEWAEDCEENSYTIADSFGAAPEEKDDLPVSTAWYGVAAADW